MSITSMTDQVIIRVYRIRKILANDGKASVSEGIAAQLHDVVNYCIFALIKMGSDAKRLCCQPVVRRKHDANRCFSSGQLLQRP